ncbi:peptidoglycan editing factor PgeF [Acidovorax sp. LjRoot66]
MNASMPADWLVPDWPAPPGVHALCTTRAGGVSATPYDHLNLGTHVGDDAVAVRANRQVLQSVLQAATPGARAVFLNQVHGTDVAHIDGATPDATAADACLATATGAVCTIMVADCLPVLFTHRSGCVVAAAHAGWRGLAGEQGQGVLESTVQHLATEGAPAAEVIAWLGPCIGPTAFEVGAEVRAAFCGHEAAADACFVPQPGGKFLADLAGLARLRLAALGLSAVYGNDGTAPWCTVRNASRFFSHRRDTAVLGGSGRFAACIWRG